MMNWQDLSKVQSGHSYMVPSTWAYDKYPDTPVLDAGKTVTLLNQDGPGVVTCLHISNYYNLPDFSATPNTAAALQLRVWYDSATKPAIDMPLMDFLADVNAQSSYFQSLYFSKVKQSHNFRLAMPFCQHIRIEVTNPTEVNLIGYSEVQWEKVDALPPDCGYLYADYRTGVMRVPQEPVTLCEVNSAGNIVAHWLQFESDDPLCPRGELLCEGNQEFYLDGGTEPALEYLGTEDLYGFSWGFQDIQSDGVVAILKREELPSGGARIAMLRTRGIDRIRFQQSCRLVLNYQHDATCKINARVREAEEKGGILAPYRSCVYYYAVTL